MAKVNVEEMSVARHHQIVVVSVSQTQHIRGHAVGGGTDNECLHTSVVQQINRAVHKISYKS